MKRGQDLATVDRSRAFSAPIVASLGDTDEARQAGLSTSVPATWVPGGDFGIGIGIAVWCPSQLGFGMMSVRQERKTR
jgi:hypothetical protein